MDFESGTHFARKADFFFKIGAEERGGRTIKQFFGLLNKFFLFKYNFSFLKKFSKIFFKRVCVFFLNLKCFMGNGCFFFYLFLQLVESNNSTYELIKSLREYIQEKNSKGIYLGKEGVW